jgi:hypothetical protein
MIFAFLYSYIYFISVTRFTDFFLWKGRAVASVSYSRPTKSFLTFLTLISSTQRPNTLIQVLYKKLYFNHLTLSYHFNCAKEWRHAILLLTDYLMMVSGVPRGVEGSKPTRNSEVLPKLSQIPSFVEYTSVTT